MGGVAFRARGFTRRLQSGLIVLAAAACSGPQPDVGSETASIVDGEAGGDPAVVVIQNLRNGGLCTGTLIDSRVVLTAKHCVQEAFAEEPALPNQLGVGIGNSIRGLSEVLRIASVRATPGVYRTDPRGGVGADLVGSDVAVLVLQTGVAEVNPIPIRRESHTSLRGSTITAVGFGQTPRGEVGVKYTTTGTITGTTDNLLYVGAITCQGDSGGPAITEDGEVAGVVSFGAGACGSGYGAYNAIFPYLEMIDEALLEAGSCLNDGEERCDGGDNDCDDSVDEGCIEFGSECSADEECVGGDGCLNTPAGRICTAPCDPLRPTVGCGAGYYCARSEGCAGVCSPRTTEGNLVVGADCTEDSECLSLFCADPGDGRPRCLTPCRGDAGMCLAGEACAANPGTCGGCVDAAILRAARALGEPCVLDDDCLSGTCLADGARSYCTRECEDSNECADGFHCRAGACVSGPRGEIGDPCVDNGDCEATFCAVQGDRSWCTNFCHDRECPEGFVCTEASGAELCVPDLALAGESCSADSDCVSEFCTFEGPPSEDGSGVCSRLCGPDAPCATGLECRRTEDGRDAICLSPVVETEGGCSAGPSTGLGPVRGSGWGLGLVAFALVFGRGIRRGRRKARSR